MNPPLLIIVSGLPASGKTTLARRLAEDLRLPLIGRDEIKERLFDSLGWNDRATSQRLGAASWALLYWALDMQLSAGKSCIVDSNFAPERDAAAIVRLRKRFSFRAIELHCHADGSVLVERFIARVQSGERHAGHVDYLTIDEVRDQLLQSRSNPMSVADEVLSIDTTNPTYFDYDAIEEQVRLLMVGDA